MQMSRSVRVGGCLLAAWLGMTPVAAAQEPAGPSVAGSISLQWDAPASCPTQAQVMEAVGQMIIDPERLQHTRMTAHGVISRLATDYELDLTMEQGGTTPGQRRLLSEDCDELARAAALILALAIDPNAKPPEPPPPPEPGPELAWNMGVGPMLELGSQPRLAFGGVLRTAMSIERWEVGLLGMVAGFQSIAVPGTTTGKVRFSSWRVELEGAHMFGSKRWQVGPSLALGVGVLRAKSSGANDAADARSTNFNVALGVATRVRIGARFGLLAHLKAAFPWPRDFFRAGTNTLHRADVVNARLLVLAEVHL